MPLIKVKGKLNQSVEFMDIHTIGRNSTISNTIGVIKSYLVTPECIYAGIIRKGKNGSDDEFNECEYISQDMLLISSENVLLQKNSLKENVIKVPVKIKDKLRLKIKDDDVEYDQEYEIHTIYIDENNIIYSIYDEEYANDNNIYDKKQILRYVRSEDINDGYIMKFV